MSPRHAYASSLTCDRECARAGRARLAAVRGERLHVALVDLAFEELLDRARDLRAGRPAEHEAGVIDADAGMQREPHILAEAAALPDRDRRGRRGQAGTASLAALAVVGEDRIEV